MAEVKPEVLSAAKRALRHGASATLADAMGEEQRLSAELNALRKTKPGE